MVESRQCLSLIQGKVMAIAVLAGLERNLTNSSLYKIGGLLWIMTWGRGSGRAPEVKLRFLPGSLFINIIIIDYYLLLLLSFLINIIYYYYESCVFAAVDLLRVPWLPERSRPSSASRLSNVWVCLPSWICGRGLSQDQKALLGASLPHTTSLFGIGPCSNYIETY